MTSIYTHNTNIQTLSDRPKIQSPYRGCLYEFIGGIFMSFRGGFKKLNRFSLLGHKNTNIKISDFHLDIESVYSSRSGNSNEGIFKQIHQEMVELNWL